jgi:hypothetical protein
VWLTLPSFVRLSRSSGSSIRYLVEHAQGQVRTYPEVGTGHGRRALFLPSRFPLWVGGFVAKFVRTGALQLISAGASLCGLRYGLVAPHGEMVCGLWAGPERRRA